MTALAGKVALITGAARGIGAATAALFAREGARVMIADVNDVAGAQAAAGLPGCAYRHHDVADESSWQATVDATLQAFGRLDVLVNNAGIYRTAPIEETSVELFTRTFQVNQLGVFLGMRAVLPAMKAQGGSIVNLSSTSGFTGNQYSVAYGGTKWAVRGMTKIAAVEFGRYGIRVNSVHPGLVDTPMNHEEMGHDVIAAGNKRIPLGRVGVAEDIARVILFLASDQAGYVSGGEFAVDGAASAGVMRPRFTQRRD
ncbi:MAG: SDR family NAD(P)-dependent oxidoreductase [Gammaproteobacteria bacterium]